jgi:hypothetical protein
MLSSAADDNSCGILGFSSLGAMVLKPAVEVKAVGTRKNEPNTRWGAASHKRDGSRHKRG